MCVFVPVSVVAPAGWGSRPVARGRAPLRSSPRSSPAPCRAACTGWGSCDCPAASTAHTNTHGPASRQTPLRHKEGNTVQPGPPLISPCMICALQAKAVMVGVYVVPVCRVAAQRGGSRAGWPMSAPRSTAARPDRRASQQGQETGDIGKRQRKSNNSCLDGASRRKACRVPALCCPSLPPPLPTCFL